MSELDKYRDWNKVNIRKKHDLLDLEIKHGVPFVLSNYLFDNNFLDKQVMCKGSETCFTHKDSDTPDIYCKSSFNAVRVSLIGSNKEEMIMRYIGPQTELNNNLKGLINSIGDSLIENGKDVSRKRYSLEDVENTRIGLVNQGEGVHYRDTRIPVLVESLCQQLEEGFIGISSNIVRLNSAGKNMGNRKEEVKRDIRPVFKSNILRRNKFIIAVDSEEWVNGVEPENDIYELFLFQEDEQLSLVVQTSVGGLDKRVKESFDLVEGMSNRVGLDTNITHEELKEKLLNIERAVDLKINEDGVINRITQDIKGRYRQNKINMDIDL